MRSLVARLAVVALLLSAGTARAVDPPVGLGKIGFKSATVLQAAASYLNAGTGLSLSCTAGVCTIIATGAGTGTVTSVTAGTGLSGGAITTTGTIAVNFGTTSVTSTVGNDARLAPTPATAGRLIYDTGSAYAATLAGTAHLVLHGLAGAPTWSAVDLAADVTGVTPIANGGTGSGTQPFVDISTTQAAIAGVKTFTAQTNHLATGLTTTTSTIGLSVNNSTAALVGTTVQGSPLLELYGAAWKSNSTAASQQDGFAFWNLPATGSTVTTETLYLLTSIAGAAYSISNYALKITDGGVLTVSGSMSAPGYLATATGCAFCTATQGFGFSAGQPTIVGASGVIKWQLDGTNWIPEVTKASQIGENGQAVKRIYLSGTLTTVGQWNNSGVNMAGGWGSTAGVTSITGSDAEMRFTITASGTGIAASPTWTYTFKDLTYTSVPMCHTWMVASSDVTLTYFPPVDDEPTATTDVVTVGNANATAKFTPVTANTYTFQTRCGGTT